MTLPERRFDLEQIPETPEPRLRPAAAGSDYVSSPARALQYELSTAYAPADEPRWSPRQTALFLVVSCGGFWTAVGAGIASLI